MTANQDGIVRLTTPGAVADMNQYKIQVVEQGMFSETVQLEYVPDLDLRTGFDATSVTLLDRQDSSRPWLDPQPFGMAASVWRKDFVIPSDFVGTKKASEEFVVQVTNT